MAEHIPDKDVINLEQKARELTVLLFKVCEKRLLAQRRAWGMKWGDFIKAGVDPPEAQRLTNMALGFPPDFSPGQLA